MECGPTLRLLDRADADPGLQVATCPVDLSELRACRGGHRGSRARFDETADPDRQRAPLPRNGVQP